MPVTRFARVGRAARNHKPTIEHERLVKLRVALPDGRPNGPAYRHGVSPFDLRSAVPPW